MNRIEVEIYIYPKVSTSGTIMCKYTDTVEILKIKLEGQINVDRNNMSVTKSGNVLTNDTMVGNLNKLTVAIYDDEKENI